MNPKTKKPTSLLGRIKLFLSTDRAILMICIGIAFIFWLFTKLSDEYKSNLSVKMLYTTPKDKMLSVPPPQEIEVELKGKGWDLLGIYFQSESPSIELDITEELVAKNSAISLESKIYKLFPKATVIDIRPNTLQIALEAVATKTIPLRLDQQIELAALHGFVDSLKIEPRTVQITGPASVVRGINEWRTVPLIMQEVESDIDLKLALKRHANRNVSFFPQEVQCTGEVEALTEKKLEVPIEIRDSTVQLTILPKKVEVVCMVVLSRYDQLKAEDFHAYVDFKEENISNGEGLRVRLSPPPPYVQQVHFYPRTVDYIIRK